MSLLTLTKFLSYINIVKYSTWKKDDAYKAWILAVRFSGDRGLLGVLKSETDCVDEAGVEGTEYPSSLKEGNLSSIFSFGSDLLKSSLLGPGAVSSSSVSEPNPSSISGMTSHDLYQND
jgi:hypothetical protein